MSEVKDQHYLARKHMSWFANKDDSGTIFCYRRNDIIRNVNLQNIGFIKKIYESDNFPTNYIEKGVLHTVENSFFDVRENIIKEKFIRRSNDRIAIKNYVIAQHIRTGDNHRRIKQMEKDLLFIVKEMGLEKICQIENYQLQGRKGASSILANSLADLEFYQKMLSSHIVILVERVEDDLLLPDSGNVQCYSNLKGDIKLSGLNSRETKFFLPISPSFLIKIIVPKKNQKLKSKEKMSQIQYESFLDNISLNANEFVVGEEKVLLEAKLDQRPCFNSEAQRLSMLLNIYKSGAFDNLISNFYNSFKDGTHIPLKFIRHWFYNIKFRNALNKLFNPDNNPNAIEIPFEFN